MTAILSRSLFEESGWRVEPAFRSDVVEFCRKVHYAKRLPTVQWGFEMRDGPDCVGVVCFGPPASPYVAISAVGSGGPPVLELNRLVLLRNQKNEASYLVSRALRMLPPGVLVVAYADTEHGHFGYVYQASNFRYFGCSKERTDMDAGGNHPRHHLGDPLKRIHRSAKHRYAIATGSPRAKRLVWKALRWVAEPYPKQGSMMRQRVALAEPACEASQNESEVAV